MRSIAHRDLSPRIELLPLIDVMFLLITFFIYSMSLWVEATLLPVQFTPVEAGQAASPGVIQAINIDRDGVIYFNRQQVDRATLRTKLDQLAADPNQPALYLAVEQQSNVDRAPLFIEIVDQIQAAGVRKFFIVGQPKGNPPATGSETTGTTAAPGATE